MIKLLQMAMMWLHLALWSLRRKIKAQTMHPQLYEAGLKVSWHY